MSAVAEAARFREPLINSFRAGRPRGGRLRAQAASAQVHCAFLAFARIRLTTEPTAAKAINQWFPRKAPIAYFCAGRPYPLWGTRRVAAQLERSRL